MVRLLVAGAPGVLPQVLGLAEVGGRVVKVEHAYVVSELCVLDGIASTLPPTTTRVLHHTTRWYREHPNTMKQKDLTPYNS